MKWNGGLTAVSWALRENPRRRVTEYFSFPLFPALKGACERCMCESIEGDR